MNRLVAMGRRARSLQPVRFLAIGLFNTLFGYLVYLAGLVLRLGPETALAIATAIGALFNYFTTARYVFGHRTLNRLPLFVSAYVLIYAVNAGAIQVLLRAGATPAVAQAILIPAMAVLSFLIFRTFVFRSGKRQ